MTAVPFYIYDHLGGDAKTSGFVGAIQSASYALVCLASSRFAARSERGLLWALLGSAIFALIFPLGILVKDVRWLVACSILAMGGTALFWPAMQAWLGTEPNPAVRAKRVGIYNLSWTFGLAFGALAGGWLYKQAYWLPFAVVPVSTLTATFLVWSLPHERDHFAPANPDTDNAIDNTWVRTSDIYLFSAWAANFSAWCMINVLRNVYAKRLDDVVAAGKFTIFGTVNADPSIRPVVFGFLSLTLYVVFGLLSVQLSRMSFWKHRLSVLVALQLVAAGAFFVLGRTSEMSIMFLCFVAVGGCTAVCFFASLMYSIARPESKHFRATIHEGMVGIGGVLGPVVFGELASRVSTSWPFLLTPLFVIVIICLQVALLYWGKRWAARRV